MSVHKIVAIGLFSPRGTACVFYYEKNKLKTFGSSQQAEDYITKHHIGYTADNKTNASPVEVYEER